jgi:hypothetical protein
MESKMDRKISRGAAAWAKRVGAVALLAGLAATSARAERTNVVVVVTNNVVLEWLWTTQYVHGVSAGAGGSVEGTAGGWLDAGTAVSNRAVADPHYRFAGWQNGPAGMENDNPLLFALDGPYENVTATFALVDYAVEVVSTHPWFGEETIGNPSGAGSWPAFSTVTASVDRIVVDPENPGRRLRVKEIRVE